MGWLIALAVLVLLALLPLGASVWYDQIGPRVYLIAGPVKILLFPRKKKEKAEEKQPKPHKTSKKVKKEKPKEEPSEKGGSLTDFLPLVRLALDFLGDFRRKLRVNRLEMKLTMAGDDPCDLAVNYGRAWSVLGNLMPQLERFLVIKKRDLQVACDFTAEQTVIFARVEITITLGRILALATRYGIKGLMAFLKIMNKRKGGKEL